MDLIVGEFDTVVRAKARRFPIGIDGRLESAEAVGNGTRALVRQNDRPFLVGVGVDYHQTVLSASH